MNWNKWASPWRKLKSPSNTYERGQFAENQAADYLKKLGHRIIERNARCGPAEIDLITLDGDILCFVEVKSRKRDDQGDPAEYVDQRKQRKLVQGATLFHSRSRYQDYRVRFDVVAITEGTISPEINHIPNAFEVDP